MRSKKLLAYSQFEPELQPSYSFSKTSLATTSHSGTWPKLFLLYMSKQQFCPAT